MYTLIVTEKPDAAARIAKALDENGKPIKRVQKGGAFYEVWRNKRIVIAPAIGHLYTVTSRNKNRSLYPVFDINWVPRYMAEGGAKQTRMWLETISKLAKNAEDFIDACDYDVEGSIIGYTILKYACDGKQKRAKRMKYSTLIKEELEEAYANLLPTLDFSLVEAGLARHEIDWLYGVNLSRALTQATKKQGAHYATLSTGRVQGPTLKFLATREKSIASFVPTPYWTVAANVCIGNSVFNATYEKKIIETEAEKEKVVDSCKGKNGTVARVESKNLEIPPKPPFDIGNLQSEAYRLFKYKPMFTLKIAQRLYLDALISYPRTSSQKLPKSVGYREILEKLAESQVHGGLARELLAKTLLKPNEGKGTDQAHPAIYPTGNLPNPLVKTAERNIWDLVVERFLAVFSVNAIYKSVNVIIDIEKNNFLLNEKIMLEQGWMHFYKSNAFSKDGVFQNVKEGEEISVRDVYAKKEFTKPPARYNPSTLLKKMQKENLGTKGTRAAIIQTLYDRGYINCESIIVKTVGFEVINVLQRICPMVLSSKLTAELEERLNGIREKKEPRQSVLDEVIENLKTVMTLIKGREMEIGKQLSLALSEAKLEERKIGDCPDCKTGKLTVIRSKKTGKRFVGCSNYFNNSCSTAFPLPQKGILKPSHSACSHCGSPIVQIRQGDEHPWKFCINPNCPNKSARGRSG